MRSYSASSTTTAATAAAAAAAAEATTTATSLPASSSSCAADEYNGYHGDEEREAREFIRQQEANAAVWWRNTAQWKVAAESFSVVFLAEWGDRSMLATVALAAAKNPLGVVAGAIGGHLFAALLAVVGGSFLGKYVSERAVGVVSGALFLVFAVVTLFGLF